MLVFAVRAQRYVRKGKSLSTFPFQLPFSSVLGAHITSFSFDHEPRHYLLLSSCRDEEGSAAFGTWCICSASASGKGETKEKDALNIFGRFLDR